MSVRRERQRSEDKRRQHRRSGLWGRMRSREGELLQYVSSNNAVVSWGDNSRAVFFVHDYTPFVHDYTPDAH